MPRLSDPSSLFGRRLRAARRRAGIPQDQLGVSIGLDEGSSSARMSRYETGVHEPPFATALNLAKVLEVPVAYFYCDDDRLADFLIQYGSLDARRKNKVLALAAEFSSEMG
ncbi:helix-turn-helix domain-containing protein [Hydrogenophaga sp. BPS33]|uniref:helix-turn-helix domain-containing protein n=1 Tax=Hydrogenophaga sp. BPS33 TaxID=2651974 RepID=UPI00131F73AB|nr:helix-turn-helix transcriptional regulator [Hydrogenophaga sp. BPS33]QHE84812.1 helix-turn-helix transcriptional regulator [Hydrogenophaga sp. BPS33]